MVDEAVNENTEDGLLWLDARLVLVEAGPVKLNKGAVFVVARAGTVVAAFDEGVAVFEGVNENGVVFTLADGVVVLTEAGVEPVNENSEVELSLAVDDVTTGAVLGC